MALPTLPITAYRTSTNAVLVNTTLNDDTYNRKAMDSLLLALQSDISAVSNLGQMIGVYDTYALLPASVVAAGKTGISAGDYAWVKSDVNHSGRTALYMVNTVGTTTPFALTWTFLFEINLPFDTFLERADVVQGNGITLTNTTGDAFSVNITTPLQITGTSTNSAGTNSTGHTHRIDGLPYYVTTAHAGNTNTIAVTAGTPAQIVVGSIIGIKFTAAIPAGATTLNVNSAGASTVTYNGADLTAGMIPNNHVAIFQRTSSSAWELLNPDASGSMVSGVNQQANLASTTAANSISASTIGVTGTLPIGNGGTGQTIGPVAYGTVTTGATAPAKIGTLANFVRHTGSVVGLAFTATDGNSVAITTLNVNSTGAATVRYKGAALTAGMIPPVAGFVGLFQFDGTYWQLLNPAEWTSAAITI